ncbi:hypothetical protein NW761_013244 [Fusarium oxysporum]|nr:hypothetical protein NW758_012530 [Fusarium oxysporum]KAJ4075418.1 hypothetical protein NW761_013244 [Fusarium oxysporum]
MFKRSIVSTGLYIHLQVHALPVRIALLTANQHRSGELALDQDAPLAQREPVIFGHESTCDLVARAQTSERVGNGRRVRVLAADDLVGVGSEGVRFVFDGDGLDGAAS